MGRRLALVLVSIAALMAQPASVAASAYSSDKYLFTYSPPSYPATDLCGKAGIVDTAQNYNKAESRTSNGTCATARSLPSGYLGSQASGYINGSLCGWSSISYSNVATSGWQIWVTLCSNPSGSQAFNSVGRSYGWTGSSYLSKTGPTSPSQNY